MSWEVLFQKNPPEIKNINELPEDFTPEPLCTREYFNKVITELFPTASLEYLDCIEIIGDGYSIDIDSGEDDPLESIMLRVRGNHRALEPINQIQKYTNWKAIDLSSGEYIDFENNPDENFAKWREFNAQACQVPQSNLTTNDALSNDENNDDLNEYIVSMDDNDSLSAIKKGFNWGAFLKGPLFVYSEFGSQFGIGTGILYFVIYKLLTFSPLIFSTISILGPLRLPVMLICSSKISAAIFVILSLNLFMAIFIYNIKARYLIVNLKKHMKVFAPDADDAMMKAGEKLRGY